MNKYTAYFQITSKIHNEPIFRIAGEIGDCMRTYENVNFKFINETKKDDSNEKTAYEKLHKLTYGCYPDEEPHSK